MINLKIPIVLVIFIEFCISISLCALSKESVPILIWSDQRPPIESPAVPALQIPFSHLQGKYLETFNSKNILLFLQDTLSVEDLSSHENELRNVKKYMEKGHSLYLPSVEVTDSLSHSFAVNGYNVITLEPGSSVGELKLQNDVKNLVLVKLPSTKTNPSRQKALQKSSEIIDNVLSKVGKVADFTVIYTGAEPSVRLESKLEHRRTARSLQQNKAEEDPRYHYARCVILYLKNDILVQKGNSSQNYRLYNNHTNENLDDCQESHASIIISYKDVAEQDKVKVTFNFTRNYLGWWTIDYVKLSMDLKDVILSPQWPMEHVPLNKSYSCSLELVLQSNATEEENDVRMIIDGMQVQAFSYGAKSFSDSWDCIGFFTIPIWMGLFAGILLATILAVGMLMLSSIKTMDRFDDPKGKHIMAAASD